VAKDVGSNWEKLSKRRVTFGAKKLPTLRYTIAHEVLLENMATPNASLSRERRSATGVGCDTILCHKIATVLPFPPLVLADTVVGFFLKQALRICLCCENQCLMKCLTYTSCRKAATSLHHLIRHSIKQILPIFGALRIIIPITPIRPPEGARSSIGGKPSGNDLIHILKQRSHTQLDNGKGPLLFRFAFRDEKIDMAITVLKDTKQMKITRFCHACSTVILNSQGEAGKRIIAKMAYSIVKNTVQNLFMRYKSRVPSLILFECGKQPIARRDRISKICQENIFSLSKYLPGVPATRLQYSLDGISPQ